MTYRKYLSLFVLCMLGLLMTACTEKTLNSESISSPAVVSDSQKENPIQLVWLTEETWAEDIKGERLAAVNKRIQELGYDFEVVFEGISTDTYDVYQKGLSKFKKKNRGDLMWTGLGDGDDLTKEGTYYRQIQLGNLRSLDEWLNTDKGKELKRKYNSYIWDRIEYENKIYGVHNEKETGIFISLVLAGEQLSIANNILGKEENISLLQLCEWLEEYAKDSANKFFLEWNYAGEYYESFQRIGYTKICEGIYMNSKGEIENVWENEEVCRFWNCLAKMKRNDQLLYDDSDALAEVRQGNYPAAFISISGEIMDDDYLYQEDGSKVAVKNYTVAIPYLNKMENNVHGVTSWSKYPEEAMMLLTLVNTDAVLANLLYFGQENVDYTLVEGKVYPERHTGTHCPANPKITHFSLYEANGENKKEEYYWEVNEKYEISPVIGFVPDLKKAGVDTKVLVQVENFYEKLLEGTDEPEEMIKKFRKELKKNNYPEALKRIQKQYEKWKEGKKK